MLQGCEHKDFHSESDSKHAGTLCTHHNKALLKVEILTKAFGSNNASFLHQKKEMANIDTE